jgi:quercetin 2,3-dioxygenase
MLQIRKSQRRGRGQHGWLDSYHTFSFADFYDPEQMGFRALRVINEDFIAGGGGFATHGHKDMEILTFIVSGALEHRDSIGNSAVIRPGEVQRMNAGTGVRHSESNFFKDETTHLLQIWITPDRSGYVPSYEQKAFDFRASERGLALVVSNDSRDGAIGINQDVDIYAGKLNSAQVFTFAIRPSRHVWIQLVKGQLKISGETLMAGDGMAISDEAQVVLEAAVDSEVILFDLA